VQRFLERGGPDVQQGVAGAIRGKALPLSLQMYGCRVVQKALEVGWAGARFSGLWPPLCIAVASRRSLPGLHSKACPARRELPQGSTASQGGPQHSWATVPLGQWVPRRLQVLPQEERVSICQELTEHTLR
jgi:hypothetical protein